MCVVIFTIIIVKSSLFKSTEYFYPTIQKWFIIIIIIIINSLQFSPSALADGLSLEFEW